MVDSEQLAAARSLIAEGLPDLAGTVTDLHRVTGEEILAAIPYQMLKEADHPGPGRSNRQSELFFPQGKVSVQLHRVRAEGTYFVERDALCVLTNFPKHTICRALFRNCDGDLFEVLYGHAPQLVPVVLIDQSAAFGPTSPPPCKILGLSASPRVREPIGRSGGC